MIAKSKETLNSVYDSLNAVNPHIKFTRETTLYLWLPFLDIKFNINDGSKSKWYRKPMKKDIIMHATSAHSIITKSNIIKAMISKAELVSSESYRPEARDKAINIARFNGYYNIPYPIFRSRHIKNLPILKIPFISDKFTRNLDITLKHLDIKAQIVITAPLTLRILLIKSRIYDNKCTRVSCDICDKNN